MGSGWVVVFPEGLGLFASEELIFFSRSQFDMVFKGARSSLLRRLRSPSKEEETKKVGVGGSSSNCGRKEMNRRDIIIPEKIKLDISN